MNLPKGLISGFKVIQKTTGKEGKPLPNMIQHYLADSDNNLLSFWNDIPLGLSDDTVNACIEIPKQKNAKVQVTKGEKYHPFMQDTKKNVFSKQLQLRYYGQFPLFNYGFIPQTWEQNIRDSNGLYGDDDPIDICDLSNSPKPLGSIYKAKILGSFCLIDQGEIDWKILVVDNEQAKKQRIKDLNHYPKQQIKAIMGWFKTIKLFDGKKANKIAYDEKIFSTNQTIEIILETHSQWVSLRESQEAVYRAVRAKYHIADIN